MNTAEKIKFKREQKQLTKKQLAEMCDTTYQNIYQYETGKRNPKLSTLKKIATALDEDVFYFLDVDNENMVDKFLELIFDVNPNSFENYARSIGLNKKEFVKFLLEQGLEVMVANITGREPKILNDEIAKAQVQKNGTTKPEKNRQISTTKKSISRVG